MKVGERLEIFGASQIKKYLDAYSASPRREGYEDMQANIRSINIKGVIMAGMIGAILVLPGVLVELWLSDMQWVPRHLLVLLTTCIFAPIELYLLFKTSLRSVAGISHLVGVHETEKGHIFNGVFSIVNILSRTALEIAEPEMLLLGINPFKRVSKKNLLILSIMYKLKVTVTNKVILFLLLHFVGEKIKGVPVMYEANIVEMFWSAFVINKVLQEARLRLCGFVIANRIADDLRTNGLLPLLSEETRISCLRAIGNTVVLTKNYHPNMVILLLEFYEIFQIADPEDLDNWDLFVKGIAFLPEQERYFVLDLLCVAAAFDGKISDLESHHLGEAFGQYEEIYTKRLFELKDHLISGDIEEAYALCKLDFVAG
jgi:hypothetical protein